MSKPLITLDMEGIARSGVSTLEQMRSLDNRLLDCQQQMESDADVFESGATPPAARQPLDSAFYRLPEKLLSDYRADRAGSELSQMLEAAKRLRENSGRVVVLGIGGSYMGAKALMESCCEPYFNELSNADRGGRPRMYFEGNNLDNDAVAGLLRLLDGADEDWSTIVISKSGGTLETAAAFRVFLRALEAKYGEAGVAERVVPVTGETGKLRDLSTSLGCKDVFAVPDGVGGRFSVLSPVGLLPAAVLGINVIELLEGAAAMNEHLRSAAPADNVPLAFAAMGHLLEQQGLTIRVQSAWHKGLESLCMWYDQLLSESLGKAEKGATPITAVNTRDLHSRAQQHQEGRKDKLFVNLTVDSWREDPIAVGHSERNQDQLNDIADRVYPELMDAAIRGTNQALEEAGRPTVDLRLPSCSEHVVGQLLQMLMIATVVEGRLMDVNPYGQPGVEAYKQNMARLLGRA